MPRSTPEEREGEFVPPEKAQDFGYYGTNVSEYPNEMYTANEIVKRSPGGPVGVSEEEARESVARQVPKFEPEKGADDRSDTPENLRKEQEEAAKKREEANEQGGSARAEDDSASAPRRTKLGK